METEEEQILLAGGRLAGSMIGRRRVLTTWAVGEAWERFTRDRREVVVRAFRVLGISLPISGACDQEISVKGVDLPFLIDGLQNWREGGGLEEEEVELDEGEDESEIFYEEN